jgi:predicted negative regulator of RcsB-dependent stress response
VIGRIPDLNVIRRLALIVCLSSADSAVAATGHPDLDLGLARFALDTGDYARALHYTRHPETEHEILIHAKVLLETGQEDQATRLLERLTDGQYFRGEAALLRSTLLDGNSEKQTGLLELAAKKGHGETRQRALYRLAEIERKQGRRERAGQVLASMDSGYWAALGYMNIAADYGNQDTNPSRAFIALRVAMAMAEEDPDKARGEALKAVMLVRAGLLAYESKDYDKAVSFLKQVPLNSYSTPQALYLHGLALSENGNYRDAMQSWHRAKKYPLAFPGVAGSWLGTGRGYDLAGYLGQAGEAYLSASATYESERVTLRDLTDLIREKGAYEALVDDAGRETGRWFLEDSRALTQPRNAYLLRFMEDAQGQQAVQRVRELREMLRRMDDQARTLEVFREVLQDRMGDSVSSAALLPEGFENRMVTVKERISRAGQSVTAESDNAAELQKLSATLKDLQTSADRLDQRLKSRDQRLDAQLDSVNQSLNRLAQNRRRASDALGRASALLDERVLAHLAGERQRMMVSLEKAEQQIAHLYEYLALQNLDRSSP